MKINYKGIARVGSDQGIADGWLEEAINVRHRDGKFTARGTMTKLYDISTDKYDKIWLHDQDDIYNFIGYVKSTGQLYKINMETGAEELVASLTVGIDVNVVFIKRFMIITGDKTTLTYLFYEGAYVLVSKPPVPVVKLEAVNQEYIESDTTSMSADSIRGNYYKEVNKQSSKYGKQTGGMMYRIAYRMFDGSYILHTLPRFLDLGIEMGIRGVNNTGSGYRFTFCVSNVQVTINPSDFIGINSNIFTDVEVFASKCCNLFDISKDAIDDDTISDAENAGTIVSSATNEELSVIDTVLDDDFKNLVKSGNWYKIYEKRVEDIQAQAASFTEILNDSLINQKGLKDYYQDYANREALTVDQFSHHTVAGSKGYVYNDRLLLGDIRTVFGQYPVDMQALTDKGSNIYAQQRKGPISVVAADIGLTTYDVLTLSDVVQSSGTVVFEFTIDVPGKRIKAYREVTNQPFYIKTDNSYYYFVLPEIVGYPDSRASKMRLLFYDTLHTRYIDVASFSLTKSSNDNFAFYHEAVSITESTETSGIYSPQTPFRYILVSIDTSTFSNKVVTLSETEDYIDSNRIQASELQNPLYFPAENSYQVGTGTILGMAANTEPLSQGQFGEYPLAVFTTKGIWTMLQGSGDVLFQSILPLNGEVVTDSDQIIPLSVGVAYRSARGLFLLSGREVKNISEMLLGPVNSILQADSHYQYFLNHANLVQLVTYLSSVDAKTYLSGARLGFDKVNNELLVTNSSYAYSYVFSFESQYWYKISNSFDLLINAYPKLLVRNSYGVYSLSDETFDNPVQVLLTTRPVKLTDNSFKLIRGAIQRCQLNTTDKTFAAFYMFASNDLRKWQFMTGNDRKEGYVTDIRISRAQTKAKYFIFILAGSLEENSMINDIEIDFDPVLQSKLR